MGNYSKNPQTALQEAVQKGYSRVRFQQGKPILDRELNLASDLAAPNRILQQYVGSGVPDGSDGFNIRDVNHVTHDFVIRAGRCIVNGFEVVLANDTTYKLQPHRENVRQFPPGASLVYLRVFTVEVNEAQDADLRNSTDIGFETALRERVDWEVLILPAAFTAPDHFLLGTLVFSGGEGPPPDETSALKTSPSKAAARAAKRPTVARAAEETTTIIPPPPEPAAGFTDARVTGLKLTRVRADLDLLMNSERNALKDNSVTGAQIKGSAVDGSKLATQSVRVSHFNATVVIDNQITIAAGSTSNVVMANRQDVGNNPWFLVSIWGNGSYEWKERSSNNDRLLIITNLSNTNPITINVKTLKLTP